MFPYKASLLILNPFFSFHGEFKAALVLRTARTEELFMSTDHSTIYEDFSTVEFGWLDDAFPLKVAL